MLTNEKVAGTPMYLPPELSLHRRVSRTKSDLWAVGVIAWELVADSNPWNMDMDAMSERQIMDTTNKTGKLQNFEKMPKEYVVLDVDFQVTSILASLTFCADRRPLSGRCLERNAFVFLAILQFYFILLDSSLSPSASPSLSFSLLSYFDLIKGLVCPVDERMTVEEAMALKMFSHIDFSDMDGLFPRRSRAVPRDELGNVVERLKVMSPMAFQEDRKEEGVSTRSFFSEDMGEEEVQSLTFEDCHEIYGETVSTAIGEAWAKAEGDDKVLAAAEMSAREESEREEKAGRGGNEEERGGRRVMRDWMRRQDVLYAGHSK